MPQKPIPFRVRDFRKKGFWLGDDAYLNSYARYFDTFTTAVYFSLCRHADKNQSCFPAQSLIAEEHNMGKRTVIEKLKVLEEWKIIKKKKVRSKNGKWLNNTYFLLDKSEWKQPSAGAAHGSTKCRKLHNQVQELHTKDTHKKDTHITLIHKCIKGKTYGNQDVNKIISYFKERLHLPMLDGSEKQNRRYGWLLLKKFNGVSGVTKLIDFASEDDFWKDKLASLQKLYYKGVEIISRRRGNGDSKKAAIDATAILPPE